MNDQLTIKQLYKLCVVEIQRGNADKKIAISDDNEGNGFHGLFFGFTNADEFEGQIYDSAETDVKKLMILG